MSVMQGAAARLTNSVGNTEGSGVYLRCGKRTLLITCAHVQWTSAKARLLKKLPVKPSGAGEICDLAIYEWQGEAKPGAFVTWEGLLFPWTEGVNGLVSVYGFAASSTCRPKECSVRRSFDGDGLLQFPSDHSFDPGKGDSGAGVWHGDHLIGIFRQRVSNKDEKKENSKADEVIPHKGEQWAYGVIPLCHVMAAYPELWRSPSLRPKKRHDFFFDVRLGQEKQARQDKEAAELYEFPRSVEDPQRLARAMEVHPWDEVVTQKTALSHGAFLLAGEPGGGKTTLSHEAAEQYHFPLMLLRDLPLSAALLKWHTDFPALAARCFAGTKLWLDGLDELPDFEQTQWLTIASRYKAGKIKGVCFITCRTAFVTPEMNEHVTENKPWFLLGLSPQEKPKFLREYATSEGFPADKIEPWIETWQAMLGRSPVLARLSGSPLLLRLLAELYDPSRAQDLHKIEGVTLDEIYFQMAEGLLKQRKPDVHVQETDTLLECLYHLAGHEQPISKEWHVTISKPVYAKACKTCKVEPALSDVLERSQLIHLNGSRYEWLHLTFLEWAWAAFTARTCDEEAIVALYQTSWHLPRMENALTLLWGMLETNVRCRIATWLWQHAEIAEDVAEERISCPLRACLHFYGKSGTDIEELPELVAFVTVGGEKRRYFRYVVAGDKFISSSVLVELSKDESEHVRLNVAENSLVPQQAMRCLVNDPSEDVRRGVALNPSTPQDQLGQLANDEVPSVRLAVASSSSIPLDLLNQLAGDPLDLVRYAVARNSSITPELLTKLSGDPWEWVRRGVALNPSLTPELLTKLSSDPSKEVRGSVAQNSSLTPELLTQLANDPLEDVRRGVAVNSSLTPELLTKLSNDPLEDVRCEVAKNSSLTPELLAKLADDPSGKVRSGIAKNSSITLELLTKMSGDPEESVRQSLASNPSAPLSALSLLSQDENMLSYLAVNPSCPLILLLPKGKRT